MQEDKKAKYDQVIQKRIKEEGLEKPALNFTNAVISRIEAQKASNFKIRYEPLIPKRFWYLGAASIALLFFYMIYGNVDSRYNWISEEIMQQWEQMTILERVPDFDIADSYIYAFIGLAFFVGIQVYLLRNHFDKRYFIN